MSDTFLCMLYMLFGIVENDGMKVRLSIYNVLQTHKIYIKNAFILQQLIFGF